MGMSLNKDRYRVGAALQVYPFRGERGLSGLPQVGFSKGAGIVGDRSWARFSGVA